MFRLDKKEWVALSALVILVGLYLFSVSIVKEPSPAVRTIHVPIIPTPSEIIRGDTTKKQVIFTFDGGEGTQSADAILNALKKHAVHGTFFLTGRFIEKNPELAKRIIADGNEVFNHSYSHPHLTDLNDDEIAVELKKMDDVLFDITGTRTGPYFRPPYGDYDRRVLDAAAGAGYRGVYWTIDAGDWEESTGMTAKMVRDRILYSLAPGNIYLMHIGDNITGAILEDVFTMIETKRYRIVPLTKGL